MKFQALIDGVHFDPKKGAVKIVLIGSSHVSLDELTTLSPKDETVQVTLESEQTKIKVFPLTPTGVAVEPGSREEIELESKGHDRAEELVMKGLGLEGDNADTDDDVPPDGLPVDEGEEGNSKHESEEEKAEVEGGREEG